MTFGGASPRGGSIPAGGDDGYPAPGFANAVESGVGSAVFGVASSDANDGVRVTHADATRGAVIRAFIAEHRTRRDSNTNPTPSSWGVRNNVDALLDSMEAATSATTRAGGAGYDTVPLLRTTDDALFPSLHAAGGGVVHGGTTTTGTENNQSAEGTAARGTFGIDVRAAARWLEHSVPVAAILCLAFLLKHVAYIAAFGWCAVAFHRADDGLRNAVGLRSAESVGSSTEEEIDAGNDALDTTPVVRGNRANAESPSNTSTRTASTASSPIRHHARVSAVMAVLGICLSAILVVAALFPGDSFWDALVLRFALRDDRFSFTDALWRSGMADVLTRTVTVFVKGAFLLLTDVRDSQGRGKKKRSTGGVTGVRSEQTVTTTRHSVRETRLKRRAEGAALAVAEHISLLLRCVLPITTWFAYFMGPPISALRVGVVSADMDDLQRLGRCAATGAYLAVKARQLFVTGVGVKESFLTYAKKITDKTGFGAGTTSSTESEIEAASNECTVCCDVFEDPVTLTCGHVFCEKCVWEWFQRSRQCPLCRAVVAGNSCGAIEHGDGATVAFPYVF